MTPLSETSFQRLMRRLHEMAHDLAASADDYELLLGRNPQVVDLQRALRFASRVNRINAKRARNIAAAVQRIANGKGTDE